jgi:PAS domain S-box-containing protein
MVPFGTSSQPPASKEDGGPNGTSEAGVRAKSAGRIRVPTALAYLIAVVLTAATLLLRLTLSSRFGDHPALELFLIPIILSAFAGGLGPGLVSTALAGIATDYFLLPPKYSFAIQSGLHSLEWLVLILAGTLMSVLLRKSSVRFPGAAACSVGNERPGSPGSEAGVSRTILISAGSICAALGTVSLVGWFFHIAALTRVGPSFNPMVANSAVGLFLDGLALLFLAAGWPKAALGGAVWSLLAGILTLAEFSFSIDLHIDELLVRDYIRALPASPGRPAPNAALCLVFCGVALLWASTPRWREKAAVIIGVLGAVVFALGAAAVSGYLTGLPMYAFGDSKPMAANAGLGFSAMGLGVMALAWRRSQPSPEAEARILFSAERKVRAGFALALAALILIGGMSYFSLVKLHEDRVWVDHTRQVIASLQLVLFDITEARAEQRSYIVTRDEQYLASYRKAVQELAGHLRGLRPLTADNPGQRSRLDMLAPLVAARLAVLQEGIERLGNRDPATAIAIFGRGQQLDERVRGLLEDMEAAEETLLEERQTHARHAGTVARTVIVAGITLAFVFVVVALFVISADFAGSRRARAALQEARDQLETRVQQRTAELAKANEATLDSEARLAGIIHSAMDAILTVDKQQRIVLFNPAAEKMFGCGAADALGQPLDRFIPERLRSAHARHIRDFGETHVTQRQVGRLGPICALRSSGEEFPIEAAISRVDVGGQKLFTAILRDITERKAAEEALRRQASLIDQIHDAVLVWEWDGPIISWNCGAERLYGYRAHEAIGRVPRELLRTETTIRVEGLLNILEQTKVWEGELLHVTRDGRKIIVESRMTRMHDKDQAYVLETNRDITERKRAQEKLIEAHRRTTAILESISDGFNTFDREWRYTHVNAAAAKMLGKAPEELLGKNVWELWPHAADSPFGVAYRRAVAENVPLQVEAFYPSLSTRGLKSAAIPRPRGCRCSLTTPPSASARRRRSGS